MIWSSAHFWTCVFWTNHTSLENLETKNTCASNQVVVPLEAKSLPLLSPFWNQSCGSSLCIIFETPFQIAAMAIFQQHKLQSILCTSNFKDTTRDFRSDLTTRAFAFEDNLPLPREFGLLSSSRDFRSDQSHNTGFQCAGFQQNAFEDATRDLDSL